jgi:hypothetical protein
MKKRFSEKQIIKVLADSALEGWQMWDGTDVSGSRSYGVRVRCQSNRADGAAEQAVRPAVCITVNPARPCTRGKWPDAIFGVSAGTRVGFHFKSER